MLELEQSLWQKRYQCIAGVDEAGRGPLAGPVVAAAVVFKPETLVQPLPVHIHDSKTLTAAQRREAYQWIHRHALAVAVSRVEAAEIDRINIRNAAMLAMKQALSRLYPHPDYVLVDGHAVEELEFPQLAVIRGDQKSISIAAASIIAKVERDAIMERYHQEYPHYRFDRNKGYPTPQHLNAILKYGLTPIHRRSFRPKKLQEMGFYPDEH